MRRLAAAPLTALLATTLLLAACSGGAEDPQDSPTPTEATDGSDGDQAPDQPGPTADDVSALEAVTVEGALGSAPTVEFETPFDVTAPVARVDTEGDGADLESGQRLTLHYVALNGDDASEAASTWEADSPEPLTLGDEGVVPALNEVLDGQQVGVRVLFAAPSRPATEATEQAPATEEVPATVMAIEVVDARSIPERAEGEAVEPPGDLPTVTLADDGQPSIEIPDDFEEPSELVVQPLVEGTGEPVEQGQTVTFQYSGWLTDGTVFDSSWERGAPFTTPIGAGRVIPGWDEGLVGQPVGSQVLLVIPPEMAYGDQDTGGIPPNSTLIFVVDILDAI